MELINQFVIPGILFLLTMLFGFWLSRAGIPYNGLLFNIHKLIALACVVLLGIQVSKTLLAPDGLLIALLTVSALCVTALFASGALMSTGKLKYSLMLTIHRIAPAVLVIGLGLVVLLLNRFP